MTTEQQAQYWRWAAWTSPFVALAIILGEHFFGFDSIINVTSVSIVAIFITVSVFWWWWAISRIVYMMKKNEGIEKNFESIKQELREIRKDVGNRQWREPEID